MLKLFPINHLIFIEVRGQRHIGVFLSSFFLIAPVWANGWTAIKLQEPVARWELFSVPFVPAPLEKEALHPLFFQEKISPMWAYPTEAEFVAYPTPPAHSLWVAVALERYQ